MYQITKTYFFGTKQYFIREWGGGGCVIKPVWAMKKSGLFRSLTNKKKKQRKKRQSVREANISFFLGVTISFDKQILIMKCKQQWMSSSV